MQDHGSKGRDQQLFKDQGLGCIFERSGISICHITLGIREQNFGFKIEIADKKDIPLQPC